MLPRPLATLALVGILALAPAGLRAAAPAAGQGWLGLTIQGVEEGLEGILGPGEGVLVAGTAAGGPAAGAGLRCLDLVTAVNGVPVREPQEVVAAVAGAAPGTAVTLDLRREGQPLTLKVVLAARPAEPEPVLKPSEMLAQGPVTALCDLRNPYGFVAAVPAPGSRPLAGLVVRTVVPDSPAASRGLERGMVILGVGRAATASQDAFEREAARWAGQPLVLQVTAVPGGPARVLVVPTAVATKAGPAFTGTSGWSGSGTGRVRPGVVARPRP